MCGLILYSVSQQLPRRERPWYNRIFTRSLWLECFPVTHKEDVKHLSTLSPSAPTCSFSLANSNIDHEPPQLSTFFCLLSMDLHDSTIFEIFGHRIEIIYGKIFWHCSQTLPHVVNNSLPKALKLLGGHICLLSRVYSVCCSSRTHQ